jgi:glycosyltransferase involved in cell wall biosynthesis
VNILLINHYAGSVHHGMEYRPFYLAREWVKAGHRVHILAASYSHVRSLQPPVEGARRQELIAGVTYTWFPTPTYHGNGLGRIKNIVSFLWAVWRSSQEWAQQFKPDVVIASSTYPMDIWPAQRIARQAKAKLVYEVHDLWPLSPMALGGLSKWHPFIVWVQWAEDKAYRVSDRVVSMLPKTLDYMQSRGLAPAKWSFVPNGIDLEEWTSPSVLPSEIASLVHRLKVQGLPLVGYAGSHGLANALDTLLDAAALLKDRAVVVLAGHGPEHARLAKRAQDEGLAHVHFVGSIPKAAIPAFLQAIDMAYIGWLPNPMYRFGIAPNKLMDYMMAGKPIVHSVDAGNDLVQEAGCGQSVLPGDPAAVAEAVQALLALMPDQRAVLGQRGRTYVQKHHSYEALAASFISMINATP